MTSNSANGHTSLFLLSLTGQKIPGNTVDVYVGQVGQPDAEMVPFEAVMWCCLWGLARERGRGRKLTTSSAISRTNMTASEVLNI